MIVYYRTRTLLLKILIFSVLFSNFPLFSEGMYSYGAVQRKPFLPSANMTQEGRAFYEAAEGQEWFLSYIEEQLNMQEKSINTLNKDPGINDLERIVTIGLKGEQINGKLPKAIGMLTNLRHIYLADTGLSGSIPDELWNLTSLETLDLSSNRLSGTLSEKVEKLVNLKVLLLWHNELNGSLPNGLSKLINIENLDLADNRFTGPIPAQALSGLPHLQVLHLSRNPFTAGPVPEEFSQLPNLTSLMLENTNRTGELPISYQNLSTLQILELSNNRITGELPPSYSNLSNLTWFAVSYNQLTGKLPSSYSNLKKAERIDLSNNQIKGEIPQDYEQLTRLQKLVLSHNQISEQIPDIFSGMDDLFLCYLDHNKLAGFVPHSLIVKGQGTIPADIDVSYNYLTRLTAPGLAKEADNFMDSAAGSVQNQLALPSYLKVDKDSEVNLYTQLYTLRAGTGQGKEKALLPTLSYIIILPDNSILEVGALQQKETAEYKVRLDANGIFVTLKEDIPRNQALKFKIQLRYNDGSAFSTTEIHMGTEEVSSGGGGGAAGSPSGGSSERPVFTHERYVKGYEDGTFKPEGSISREETAVIFYRLKEAKEGELSKAGLERDPALDVAKERWSAEEITYIKNRGIMQGYPDSTFRPGAKITRAEFATLLVRYQLVSEEVGDDPFSDISGHWADSFIKSAAAAGYLTGYPDGTFRPENTITRAEAVTMINRMEERKADNGNSLLKTANIYQDVKDSHWAFEQIIEASRTHKFHKGDTAEQWIEVRE